MIKKFFARLAWNRSRHREFEEVISQRSREVSRLAQELEQEGRREEPQADDSLKRARGSTGDSEQKEKQAA